MHFLSFCFPKGKLRGNSVIFTDNSWLVTVLEISITMITQKHDNKNHIFLVCITL